MDWPSVVNLILDCEMMNIAGYILLAGIVLVLALIMRVILFLIREEQAIEIELAEIEQNYPRGGAARKDQGDKSEKEIHHRDRCLRPGGPTARREGTELDDRRRNTNDRKNE
jgi:hypothetical protein